MNPAGFGRWNAPGSELTVEYSTALLEEIRAYAFEGFLKISRGGLEVGGLLFGTRQDDGIRVLKMRPVECQHATGPSFVLSQGDKAKLADQIESSSSDGVLSGLELVGLFISHSRNRGLYLTEPDLALMEKYLPERWHVALVLRPERSGSAQAAFFVRDGGGRMPSEAGLEELQIRPAGVPAAAPEAETRADIAPPALLEPRRPRSRRRWIWLAAWAIAVIACVALSVGYYLEEARPEPLNLRMTDLGQQVMLEWNRPLPRVFGKQPEGATVDVTDGGESRSIRLDSAQFARGVLVLPRKTGDFKVALRGTGREETSRLVAPPPPVPQEQELTAARAEIIRLQAENAKLAADFKTATQDRELLTKRAAQLETLLRIEQRRLEVARSGVK